MFLFQIIFLSFFIVNFAGDSLWGNLGYLTEKMLEFDIFLETCVTVGGGV